MGVARWRPPGAFVTMPRVKEATTRVIYLSDAPYEGGAERYLVRLAGGLDRRRFEPCLLLPDAAVLNGVGQLAMGAGRRGRTLPEAWPAFVRCNVQ